MMGMGMMDFCFSPFSRNLIKDVAALLTIRYFRVPVDVTFRDPIFQIAFGYELECVFIARPFATTTYSSSS